MLTCANDGQEMGKGCIVVSLKSSFAGRLGVKMGQDTKEEGVQGF